MSSYDKNLDSFKVWLNLYEERHHGWNCEIAAHKSESKKYHKRQAYGINLRKKTLHKVYLHAYK